MYKAVALDLDGTILTSENKLTEKTKAVLGTLKGKGIKVVIATGRTFTTSKPVRDKLGFRLPLITNNGSRVYDENNNLINEFSISAEIVNKILAIKRDVDMHLNVYNNEKWYVEKENYTEQVVKYQNHNNFYYKLINFEKFKDKSVTKFVFMGNYDDLLEIDKILKNIGSGIKTMFSTEFSLEIISSKTSKAAALAEILNREKIEMSEIIAFGDGFNDYEMLNNAGKGCIMGNAHYKLKDSLPHLEVIGSNDEEGVAAYLEKTFEDIV